MKKNEDIEITKIKKDTLKFLVLIFLLFTFITLYLLYFIFFSMNRLPEGEYIKSSTSPEGTYEIDFYLADGGATTGYAIRGKLHSDVLDIDKNIYWEYKSELVSIKWIDDGKVNINGHTLTLPNEIYDFRRDFEWTKK